MEDIVLIIGSICLIVLIYLYWLLSVRRFKYPEKVLKDVEIYLQDPNVPNYLAIQTLEKALRKHPENINLQNKLTEIKNNSDSEQKNHKLSNNWRYILLFVAVIAIPMLISVSREEHNILSIFTSIILFLIAAVIIVKLNKS